MEYLALGLSFFGIVYLLLVWAINKLLLMPKKRITIKKLTLLTKAKSSTVIKLEPKLKEQKVA